MKYDRRPPGGDGKRSFGDEEFLEALSECFVEHGFLMNESGEIYSVNPEGEKEFSKFVHEMHIRNG